MSKIKKTENALLFLTLLFLPTQLGKHFWPDFSFIYSLKIDYLSPVIYFWDLLAVLLLAVFVLQRKKINRLALNLFLLFILASSLNINSGVGLVRLEQYLISGLFGVYFASIKIKDKISIFTNALSLALIYETLIALGQVIFGKTLGLWVLGERTFSITTPGIAKFDFQGIEILRPYATFPHPNVLAGFMILTALLLFVIKKKATPVYILVTITTLLTASRAALLAGFFASLLILPKNILKWLFLFIIIVSPFLFVRFSSVFNFDSLTILRREQLSQVAIDIFSKSPIFGVGLNNFIPAAADQLLVGPSRFLQPVHNIFLLQLSETGIIGLLGLLALIGVPLIKNRSKVLLVVWGIIIFLGMFDHYFLTLPQGQRMLFLVWGLVLGLFNGKNT